MAQDDKYGSIKPLDLTSVHRIHSGQVVLSLESCLKELVENSIDAGATSIEIRLKDMGAESIEVVDNGCGIDEKDWKSVGLKSHTSKLSNLSSDATSLSTLSTFGFRGEALSALCALSESLQITTATAETKPLGNVLKYDMSGKLIEGDIGKVARQRGTSILITSLFTPIPVRRKELERKLKTEFARALNLLTAYALVPACGGLVGGTTEASGEIGLGGDGKGKEREKRAGIRLTVDSIGKSGKKTNHLKTDGKASLRSSISSIWGNKALENLLDINLEMEVEMDKAMAKREGLEITSTTVRVRGLVSDAAFGCGRTSSDRQFFYINGRPFLAPRIARAVNEAYKSFNTNQFPFAVLDIEIAGNEVDVNVSPDKREIFLHNEGNLLESLKAALDNFWQPSRSTFAVNGASSGKRQTQQQSAMMSTRTRTVHSANEDEEEDELEPEIVDLDETPALDRSLPLPARSRQRSPVQSQSSSGSRLAPRRPASLDGAQNTAPLSVTPAKRALEYEEEEDSEAEEDDSPAPTVEPNPPLRDRPFKINGVVVSPSAPRMVQTTLDTSQASWNVSRTKVVPNLRAPTSSSAARLGASQQPATTQGRASRQSLRERLAGFASASQPVKTVEISDDEEEHEGDEVVPDSQSQRDLFTAEVEEDGADVEPEELSADGEMALDAAPMDVDLDNHSERQSLPEDCSTLEEQVSQDVDVRSEDNSRRGPPTAISQYRNEIATQTAERRIQIKCNVQRIRRRYGLMRVVKASSARVPLGTALESVLPEAGLDASAEQADNALSRVIHKEDFAGMTVLGQFNRALIIARRKTEAGAGKSGSDDLFIVDQHASDEKYNFETLQQTTEIKAQKLILPKDLQLTSADEITASENLDVLRRNGFGVSVDEDAPFGRGLRIKLTAMPISKDTKFDTKDLEELIFLLRDNHASSTVRCGKARKMFASRACRKSVMFGDSLNSKQMTQIVQHMGLLEQPWNCPHGRPTMRHLVGVTTFCRESPGDPLKTTIDWESIELS